MGTRYKRNLLDTPTLKARDGTNLWVLKPGRWNRKLGGRFTRGKWRGMRIWSLTLEEQSDNCPADCLQWSRCYGRNMPFAHRYSNNAALLIGIRQDLMTLTGRGKPYAVRLHVLGDFPSVGYVMFWQTMLALHTLAHVWGYTHWKPQTDVGQAIRQLAGSCDRFRIMASDGEQGDTLPRAVVVDTWEDNHDRLLVPCPEQTGRVPTCGACGLCVNGRTEVAFHAH